MTYFKQLTGSKLPKPIAKKFKVGDNKFEYGVIYVSIFQIQRYTVYTNQY
jgi:hypothetical protein